MDWAPIGPTTGAKDFERATVKHDHGVFARFVQHFDVGGFRYDVILDRNSTTLSVLDAQMDVQRANVGLIDKNGSKTTLRGTEMQAFCWTASPDAVAEVLARSPVSLKFVSSLPDA